MEKVYLEAVPKSAFSRKLSAGYSRINWKGKRNRKAISRNVTQKDVLYIEKSKITAEQS